MTIRDLIAAPFWLTAIVCDWLAVSIGGTWTAEMYIDGYKRQAREVYNKMEKL